MRINNKEMKNNENSNPADFFVILFKLISNVLGRSYYFTTRDIIW